MSYTKSDIWDQVHQKQDWGLEPNGWFLEFYERYYKDSTGLTFIDIGCGGWAQILFLASKGHSVIAVNIYQTALNKLKTYLSDEDVERVTTICSDAVDYRATSNSIDCVVEVSMLECLTLENA